VALQATSRLHADARASLQRLQGLLNQAIIAEEDVEGYFVMHRVSFIIAGAVGRQLAARWVWFIAWNIWVRVFQRWAGLFHRWMVDIPHL
jgi:hypothetical protein